MISTPITNTQEIEAVFRQASRIFKTVEAQAAIAFLEIALGHATEITDEED